MEHFTSTSDKALILKCKLWIPVILSLLYCFASCEFKNEEEEFPPGCDTANLKHTDVQPIFEAYCLDCHKASSYNYIKLDTYDGLKNAANTGQLTKAIGHLPGARPMPDGQPKLDSCIVLKVTAWIDNGTPQ